MPKRSSQDMAARRQQILKAARTCFSRKGFHATTIADLCAEAGMSAGGIYTHFQNKHEIAEAIGSEATAQAEPDTSLDLLALFDALASDEGSINSRLDLNLWAEATRDDALGDMVQAAMNQYQGNLRRCLPETMRSAGWLRLFEALTLGLEVQRALGRRQGAPLRKAVSELLRDDPC